MPSARPRKVRLAERERQAAKVVAVGAQNVEGVELDLVIVLAGVQGIEIGSSIDVQDHSLAIEDELRGPDLQRCLDDPRIALGPVVAAFGDQTHPVVLPHQFHAVAVIA